LTTFQLSFDKEHLCLVKFWVIKTKN